MSPSLFFAVPLPLLPFSGVCDSSSTLFPVPRWESFPLESVFFLLSETVRVPCGRCLLFRLKSGRFPQHSVGSPVLSLTTVLSVAVEIPVLVFPSTTVLTFVSVLLSLWSDPAIPFPTHPV